MKEIILPTERSKAQNFNPRLLVLFGFPKSGKSSTVASLDDNLIIDLEHGYRALSVMSVDVKNIYEIFAVRDAIIKKGREIKKKPYKYITIDNASKLEEFSVLYANDLYRQTSMGSKWGYMKNKDGELLKDKDGKFIPDPKADVRLLPNGAGYLYMRRALKEAIHIFLPLCDTLILVCHTKDKQINLNGEDSNILAVDLAGKMGDIICGEADAIGYIYREGNKTIMSFEGGSGGIREARPQHLRGKSFVVGESDEKNNLTMNMSQIFINN